MGDPRFRLKIYLGSIQISGMVQVNRLCLDINSSLEKTNFVTIHFGVTGAQENHLMNKIFLKSTLMI